MHYKQITRINANTGSIERPWRNRSHFFVLGDPSCGTLRHHDEYAVKVDNYGEALELVENGFSIRMSDGRSPPSLVAPASLKLVDEPVGTLDELWTYTMPETPFSRTALEDDVRKAIASQCAEIYWLANPDAANAFIGFDFDIDEVESGAQARLIDLGRFNFARVISNAYESAFRVGSAKLISDEDVDELELMIGATFAAAARRYPSPTDRPESPIRQTMLSAYLRWRISDGSFHAENVDQSLVENLAILARMSDQAVRNSLNKEGLSSKGEVDYQSILNWLEHRRDFIPLREDERFEARETWRALHDFKSLDLNDAFKSVRSRRGKVENSGELQPIEQAIATRLAELEAPALAELRAYARVQQLCIDTFVVNFSAR